MCKASSMSLPMHYPGSRITVIRTVQRGRQKRELSGGGSDSGWNSQQANFQYVNGIEIAKDIQGRYKNQKGLRKS
jgi:hypothetical protein